MTYKQIIDEILLVAKRKQATDPNGEYAVTINSLNQYFTSKFPDVDKRSVSEVIEEISTVGIT